MNLLLTWASGKIFKSEEFKVFLRTSKIVNAEKVMFSHDFTPEDVTLVEKYGFTLIEARNVLDPILDRHFHYWQYLLGKKYEKVLHIDSRDVLFQRDPFDIDVKKIMFVIEGMPCSASGFHLIEQLEYQKDIPDIFKKSPRVDCILNGGVVVGTHEAMKSYHLLNWVCSLKSRNVTDQATLNYLFNYLRRDGYEVAPPDYCLTGEAVKEGFVKPIYENGEFYSPVGKFAIFHQWDRTEYREDIICNS